MQSFSSVFKRDWHTHSLFGLTLATDFPFVTHLAEGTEPSDITFTCTPVAPESYNWEQASLVYASPYQTDGGERIAYLYRLNGDYVLRFTDVANFYISSEDIICHISDPTNDFMVEIRFLGVILAAYLELQGVPMLHASAVVIDDHAIGFLSSNKGGKSSLAALLMQIGYPLLSDDILPVVQQSDAFLGRPGYPQMRLWPEEAQYFLGHYRDLGLVHPLLSKRRVPVGKDGFGRFCDHVRPLSRIYLPQRSDLTEEHIDITPVSPRDTVIYLMQHSFVLRLVEALGLQRQRLNFFTQMAQDIPLRRLVYPTGLERLPRVREAILHDLSDLRP